MKNKAILFISLMGTGCAFALPASGSATPTYLSSSAKPDPTIINPPCAALCIKGYHSYFDLTINKCTCVPDDPGEETCLIATTCLVGSSPFWDFTLKKCSCKPNNDDELVCLAATECMPGFFPFWNSTTKKCSCKKNKDIGLCLNLYCIAEQHPVYDIQTGKCHCERYSSFDPVAAPAAQDAFNIVPREKSTSTSSPAPTPTPIHVPCEYLKIYCECGDHTMHWNEENQQCQCPSCGPVVSLGCENLKIYCNDGDHLMHLDSISKKCKCPPPIITDYAPEPLPTM